MKKETMTSRERVIHAINREPVDRVPIDLGSHMSTGIGKWIEHLLKNVVAAAVGQSLPGYPVRTGPDRVGIREAQQRGRAVGIGAATENSGCLQSRWRGSRGSLIMRASGANFDGDAKSRISRNRSACCDPRG